jgi:hypothetical protein
MQSSAGRVGGEALLTLPRGDHESVLTDALEDVDNVRADVSAMQPTGQDPAPHDADAFRTLTHYLLFGSFARHILIMRWSLRLLSDSCISLKMNVIASGTEVLAQAGRNFRSYL